MLAAAAAVVVIVVVLVGQAGSWVNRSALTRATSHHPIEQIANVHRGGDVEEEAMQAKGLEGWLQSCGRWKDEQR